MKLKKGASQAGLQVYAVVPRGLIKLHKGSLKGIGVQGLMQRWKSLCPPSVLDAECWFRIVEQSLL